MKTIAKSRLRTKEDMEGVRTEIAVQRHLTGSSAVVGIHEYFEDRANFVLVMDGSGSMHLPHQRARDYSTTCNFSLSFSSRAGTDTCRDEIMPVC